MLVCEINKTNGIEVKHEQFESVIHQTTWTYNLRGTMFYPEPEFVFRDE